MINLITHPPAFVCAAATRYLTTYLPFSRSFFSIHSFVLRSVHDTPQYA